METINGLTVEEVKEVKGALQTANEINVKTYEQVMDAADFLLDVKQIGEKITARKEEITKPMNEALKSARAFFKPFETQYTEAEGIVKDKILEWHGAHWEEGTNTDNTVRGTRGKVTIVERGVVDIEDESKIPRELCSPDLERIKKALEAGLKVKGCKLITSYTVAAGKV